MEKGIKDNEIRITDKHGASFLVEKYNYNNVERVEISLDNRSQEIRDIIEEQDMAIDISKEEYVEALNFLLSDALDVNKNYMALDKTEMKLLEAYRNKATIEVAYYGAELSKEEAYERVETFGEVVTKKGEDGMEWFGTNINHNGISAAAFYR